MTNHPSQEGHMLFVTDRFGDRWFELPRNPGVWRNADQDDFDMTLDQLQATAGPLHHVTTPQPLATTITPWSA